ncbi:hypothetical protein SAMN06298216_4541 [Spirosomataceae bacterium TFI 002]|nr:hypothetical protein SAMN06298216_4541 [Spirosomataceae bacterium TFI 002]
MKSLLYENTRFNIFLATVVLSSQVAQVNSHFVFASFLILVSFLTIGIFISHEIKMFSIYRDSVLFYLGLSALAMVYGINSQETEQFLLIVNFIKLGANQVVLVILIVLNRSYRRRQRSTNKSALFVIFVGGLSFILLAVQYFEFSTQVIVLARMLQFAIIAYYGLFRKKLSIYFTLFVFATFLGESIAGIRISGLIFPFSYFIQNIILFAGVFFFCLGIRDTLTAKSQKYELHERPKTRSTN